jgi:phosphoribosylformimino-5-aminoimidazole carboxamide ribotide isomerase
MKLYPAIDILNKKVVRLTKGKFETAKQYSDNPINVAKEFAKSGIKQLHIVDLDGAKCGSPQILSLIRAIKDSTELWIQVGGGIRSIKAAIELREAGADAVIVGSMATECLEDTKNLLAVLGSERLVLAADCIKSDTPTPLVAKHGWQQSSDLSLWEFLDQYVDAGLLNVLCTDIDRDGTQDGINLDLYQRILDRYPNLKIQASGGLTSLHQLESLAKMGLDGCVIGKSLYEKRFQLSDAIDSLSPGRVPC